MAKLISKTYGEALYEVAASKNMTADLLGEIEGVRKILDDNPDFTKLMLHPSIAKPEKMKCADSIFRGRVSDELTGFILTVIDKERFGEIDSIFGYYVDKVKEEQGIGIAYVTTPKVLDDASKLAVKARLLETSGYNTIEMHYDTDESLIGGIVIRIGDRVADSSVRTRLNDLTQQLLQIQLG